VRSLKGEVKKKYNPVGWIFSCNVQELFAFLNIREQRERLEGCKYCKTAKTELDVAGVFSSEAQRLENFYH